MSYSQATAKKGSLTNEDDPDAEPHDTYSNGQPHLPQWPAPPTFVCVARVRNYAAGSGGGVSAITGKAFTFWMLLHDTYGMLTDTTNTKETNLILAK